MKTDADGAAEGLLETLLARWDDLRQQGREIPVEELCTDAPELAAALAGRIEELKSMDWLDGCCGDFAATDVPAPADGPGLGGTLPGLIADRYRLERLIAQSRTAEVWRATDTALDRPVAVKLTTIDCVAEARRVARLKHHGIISVHDVGRHAGACFIVFDLIEGHDLAERIRQGRPSWREAAEITATVADHLYFAHQKGFVHRDIKPANILLEPDGTPVLADFGIAVTECELRHETLVSAGTLPYMAPEQLTAGGPIDARTDVYGLGVVLYELLTGHVPFEGQTVSQVRARILQEPPARIRESVKSVPAELEAICLKCLEKSPADRYPSAHALAEALRAMLNAAPDG